MWLSTPKEIATALLKHIGGAYIDWYPNGACILHYVDDTQTTFENAGQLFQKHEDELAKAVLNEEMALRGIIAKESWACSKPPRFATYVNLVIHQPDSKKTKSRQISAGTYLKITDAIRALAAADNIVLQYKTGKFNEEAAISAIRAVKTKIKSEMGES